VGEVRVYMRHVRGYGYCMAGIRQWAAQHGIDWSDFIRNGVPASKLEDMNDAIATSVAGRARKEQQNGK
jgi:hypothetical protein